jgi:2-oxoglutarate ferredoxin oxidoreductase subunit alpha
VAPGTPDMEHRIGGLEKEDVTGLVTYDAANHRKMVDLRARKIAGIAADIPPAEVNGPPSGRLLVIGWGSTHGAITAAVSQAQRSGHLVAHLHLRYLNPLPRDIGEVLARFERVLVVENNLGQLRLLLRSQFPRDMRGYNKVEGRPFLIREVRSAIEEALHDQ